MAVHRPMRSCRIEDDVYLKVKYIADSESRSFNNFLLALLKDCIKAYEKEHGIIQVDEDELYK